MEQLTKPVQELQKSTRWDYRFHQKKFSELKNRILKSPYPLHTLEDVTTQVIDGTHFTPKYTDDSGVLFLMARNIRPFEITMDDVSYISQEEHKKIIRCQPKAGDILVTKDGTIGVAAVVPDGLPEFNIFVSLIKVRPKPLILPHYLAAFLNSEVGQLQIQQQIKGASIIHIHLEDIRRIMIPLPPIEVQDRIAKVMQTAYTARGEKLADIERLTVNIGDELLAILGIDLTSVHLEKNFMLDITELSPKWRVENNNLRGLKNALQSSNYPIVTIKDLGDFITARHRLTSSFKYIEIGDIDVIAGSIILGKLAEYDHSTAPNNAQREVRKGDILISTRRPTRGAIATVPADLDGEVATMFFSIIRLKDNSVALPEYICAFLRTSIGQLQIRTAITETTYPVISDSDVGRFLLPLPTLDIQRKVVDEITRRRAAAQRLRAEADQAVVQAKAKVEQMILGEVVE